VSVRWGSEAIVYVEDQLVSAGELARDLKVDDVEAGVSRRLEIKHFGIRADRGLPCGGVGGADVGKVDAVFGEIFSDDRMGAPKDGIAGEEVITFFEKGEEGGDDGAHAGGGGEASFRALEGAEAVGEFLHGGIAEPGVDIAFLFIGKDGAHLFGIFVAEAAGEEEWRGMLFFRVRSVRIRMACVMR